MLSIPIFVIVLFVVFVAVKWGPASIGSVVLGLFLGLTIASTSFGPPILKGLTDLTTGIVQAVASLGGQR